jgi:hypothetical protein
MPWLTPVTIVGVVLLAGLTWVFFRTKHKDEIQALIAKRQTSSKLTGQAAFVEGREKIAVAIAVDDRSFFYENAEMQASLDLDRIEEIEYASDTATGLEVEGGKVLRLRSHGQTFEFIIDQASSSRWTSVMPPHLLGSPPRSKAV